MIDLLHIAGFFVILLGIPTLFAFLFVGGMQFLGWLEDESGPKRPR